MILEIEKKIYVFKHKEIWFSDAPFDISGYDSVLFRECKNRVILKGFICTEQNTLVIDLNKNLDEIWNNMEKKSCRNRIIKAKELGIKIKLNQNYEEFNDINRSFLKDKGLPKSSIDVEFMKKYGTLFVAEFDREIINGRFYLSDENNIRGLISASKRLTANESMKKVMGLGNRLIVWEAIKYAKEKGIKEYDFGGYYLSKIRDEQKEKINFFKKGFGGELTTHYNYKKDYSAIYKLTKKILNKKQLIVLNKIWKIS